MYLNEPENNGSGNSHDKYVKIRFNSDDNVLLKM